MPERRSLANGVDSLSGVGLTNERDGGTGCVVVLLARQECAVRQRDASSRRVHPFAGRVLLKERFSVTVQVPHH